MVSCALWCKVSVYVWLCVCVCVCTFGSNSKGNVGTLVHIFFTVAMWLDDTQTMRFRCACCWHAGQRGAAWQCLTLRGLRAGDQHHGAQLMTGRCRMAVSRKRVLWGCHFCGRSWAVEALQMTQINHVWCHHGAAELSVYWEKAKTPNKCPLASKISWEETVGCWLCQKLLQHKIHLMNLICA